MEDLSYSMILSIVAGRQSNLPFLPTFIITENKPISLLTFKENKLQIVHSQFKTIKEILQKLLADQQFKLKFYAIDPIICYTITKKERIRMKAKDIKEIMDQNAVCVQYIQPARPRSEDFELYYILRLEYTKSHYVSHFFKQLNYEKHEFFDSRLFEAASDIANSIMCIIETHSKKRVMILEIEFLEDIDHKLWVSFIRDIKVAEPLLCMHYIVKSPEDLKVIPIKSPQITKFTKLSNGIHLIEKKKQLRPPIDYTFIKGHIRNKKSNLAADLTISVPDSKGEEIIKVGSAEGLRRISIMRSGIKSASPLPRNNSALNARRARALRDEIMKSPELKTKYRLTGMIGVLGIEVRRKVQRSLSDSDMQESIKKPSPKRPASRLVIRDLVSQRSRNSTPRTLINTQNN